jgi:uncharacterized membrane protein YGL010W
MVCASVSPIYLRVDQFTHHCINLSVKKRLLVSNLLYIAKHIPLSIAGELTSNEVKEQGTSFNVTWTIQECLD